MFVRTFCFFFSFRRSILFARSVLVSSISCSRSSTRAFSPDFFNLLLTHTHTFSLCLVFTQLMQNVPTQSDECVCVYVSLSFPSFTRSYFARRFPYCSYVFFLCVLFFELFVFKIRYFSLLARIGTFTHTGKSVW